MDLIFSADGHKFIAKIFFDKHEEFNVQFYTGVVDQFPPIVAYLLYSSISPWGEKILHTWLFPPMVRFLHHVFGSDFIRIIDGNLVRITINVFTPWVAIIYICIPLYKLSFILPIYYFYRQCYKLNIRITEYIEINFR